MIDQTARHAPDHRLERLIFFSDAVFAIAITLLIIEIHAPDLEVEASNGAWIAALFRLVPEFLAFGLSFWVIGALWTTHHAQFALLARFDRRLVWPNLRLLLVVAFLPFSTRLLASGAASPVPYVFYAASLLLAALLKARLTTIALVPALLAPGVSPARVAIERRWRWVMPTAAFVTLLLAFVIPRWNNLGMLVLPIARRLPSMRMPAEDEAGA